MDKTARIRELNDAFRKSLAGRRVTMTVGVSSLPDADRQAVIEKVQQFDGFDRGNDPHGEHDLAVVEHDGVQYFGKIDYYTPDLSIGSEDPSDPSQTTRVLTIMRADEY